MSNSNSVFVYYLCFHKCNIKWADYFIDFQRNHKSFHSKNDSEQSSAYTHNVYVFKMKDNKTLIYMNIKKALFLKIQNFILHEPKQN